MAVISRAKATELGRALQQPGCSDGFGSLTAALLPPLAARGDGDELVLDLRARHALMIDSTSSLRRPKSLQCRSIATRPSIGHQAAGAGRPRPNTAAGRRRFDPGWRDSAEMCTVRHLTPRAAELNVPRPNSRRAPYCWVRHNDNGRIACRAFGWLVCCNCEIRMGVSVASLNDEL
jgi:hypothetical protein